APPTSLALSGTVGGVAKKRLVAPSLSLTLSGRDSHDLNDSFSAAALSATPDETPSLDINLEALETPSDSETGTLPDSNPDLEWEGQREVICAVQLCHCKHDLFVWWNLKAKCGSSVCDWSSGYYGDGMNAIILFTSCYLPENTVEDYEYVMDNLFRYIVGTLDLMVSENYLLVYLCAMAPRNKLPAMKWLHNCYTSIDRRLKKDLKGLLVVHPAWYIKALITVVKPFISEKFSRKIRFVQSLQQLSELIPTDRLQIPDAIRQAAELNWTSIVSARRNFNAIQEAPQFCLIRSPRYLFSRS
uniref:BCL2 interacting protein like n=1 Tax=Stegastes partitus TaxID=144197 RepID=A0A3B5A7W6_9TELE